MDEISKYYYLIIDKSICEEFGLYVQEIVLQKLINDEKARRKFNKIKNEVFYKKEFYKPSVKSAIIGLLNYLYRVDVEYKSY